MTAAAAPRICNHCSSVVPEGHRFCGGCGTEHLSNDDGRFRTLYYGALQAPGRAKLIAISGESIEGVSYHLTATEHVVGRKQGEIPFDDVFISPRHATFFYYDGALFVRDEGSLNGTFVRMREPEILEDGDILLAGEHLFRYERLQPHPEVVLGDGTKLHASPVGDLRFRLVELIVDGFWGAAYASPHHEVAIGREGCDLSYPDDLRMSRRHFKVLDDGHHAQAQDLKSRNGTFIRIRKPWQLHHGDFVFIGKQLLRVELS